MLPPRGTALCIVALVAACLAQPGDGQEAAAAAPAPAALETGRYVSGDAAILLGLLKRISGLGSLGGKATYGWDVETPVCQWAGVGCSQGRTGRVVSITLNGAGYVDSKGMATHNSSVGYRLGGRIDSVLLQLAKLPMLRSIRLPYNSFQGTLPGANFSSALPLLEELYLSGCNIGGPLPADWDFRNLQRLDLQGNFLKSSVQPSWGADGRSFQKLQMLMVSCYLVNQSSLTQAWVEQLPALTTLRINDCNLTGSIPPALLQRHLKYLDFKRNGLSGSLPPLGANASGLESLVLADNSFTGQFPPDWCADGSLASLQTLDVSANRLTGSMPESWLDVQPRRFPALQTLKLADNNLCGALPPGITVNTDESLNARNTLGSCPEGGTGSNETQAEVDILLQLANTTIPNFRDVFKAYSMMGWDASTPLCSWSLVGCKKSRIAYFTLNLNKSSVAVHDRTTSYAVPITTSSWTTPIPSPGMANNATGAPVFTGNLTDIMVQLVRLRHLQWLDLSNSQLSGPLPRGDPFRARAQLLRHLFATNSNISGGLPSGADWALPNIVYIDLSNNPLGGTLPADWGPASKDAGTPMLWLQQVWLQNASLTGPLPPEWGQTMFNLTHLYLSDNHLTGTLLPEWRGMKQLTQFFAARNDLGGSLPGPWGDNSTGKGTSMEQLTHLSLANNSLMGSLPPEWGKGGGLSHIYFMNLAGNLLRGQIPASWGAQNAPSSNATASTPPTPRTFPVLERLDVRPGNPGMCGPVPRNVSVYQSELEVPGTHFTEWRPTSWSWDLSRTTPRGMGWVNITTAQNTTIQDLGPCPGSA